MDACPDVWVTVGNRLQVRHWQGRRTTSQGDKADKRASEQASEQAVEHCMSDILTDYDLPNPNQLLFGCWGAGVVSVDAVVDVDVVVCLAGPSVVAPRPGYSM